MLLTKAGLALHMVLHMVCVGFKTKLFYCFLQVDILLNNAGLALGTAPVQDNKEEHIISMVSWAGSCYRAVHHLVADLLVCACAHRQAGLGCCNRKGAGLAVSCQLSHTCWGLSHSTGAVSGCLHQMIRLAGR